MKTDNTAKLRADRVWMTSESCNLADFVGEIERRTDPADYPLAAEIVSNMPVYDGTPFAGSPATRKRAGDHGRMSGGNAHRPRHGGVQAGL